MDSNKYQELVYRDVQDGNNLGVTATPTIFVNGTKVEASQDYNAIKAAIEAACLPRSSAQSRAVSHSAAAGATSLVSRGDGWPHQRIFGKDL